MKTFTFVVCFLVAVLLLAPQVQAQQCPPDLTDPYLLITGQTWAFETRASDYGPAGMASIGTFTANVVKGRGVLTISESVNGSALGGFPQYLTRLANIPGTFQVYPDCSGGQLAFNLNQQAVQWEFVFADHFRTMYMTSQALQDNFNLTKALRGTAVSLGVPGSCGLSLPDASELLDGTVWSFHTESASFQGPGSSRVGIFRPKFIPAGADARYPAAHGILGATESVSFDGIPTATRLAQESGRYVVYPTCLGGQLQINGAQPVTYDFVFANQDRTRMFLLSDTITLTSMQPGNPFDILGGTATKF